MRPRGGDLVSVIEAAYAVDLDAPRWLGAVLAALSPRIDGGVGTMAFTYAIDRATRMTIGEWSGRGVPPELGAFVKDVGSRSPAPHVRRSYMSLLCATSSEIGGSEHRKVSSGLARLGARDVLGVNGFNLDGQGVWTGALLPRERRAAPGEVRAYARVARHLAAALRLRALLRGAAAPGPEAILDADGRVQHAMGQANARAPLAALRDAVRALDRARGPLRRRDADASVASWNVLVQSRWSLLDQFESDGRRYVVAVANPPPSIGPPALSPRERLIAGHVELGQSTKVIAYDLGISDATVRVLLSRAVQKLGLRSRAELIEKRLLTGPERKRS